MAWLNNGIGHIDDDYRMRAIVALFAKANIQTRADLRTFVVSGTLPAGATIGVPAFQRALLVISSGAIFAGESPDDAMGTGL